MRIGIDISQIAYEGSGVGEFVRKLVDNLISKDSENEYILFYSSLRRKFDALNFSIDTYANVTVKQFSMPPSMLDILWNRLHILPIESLIGDIDIFISSDWTQPPTRKAKRVTILYDLIVYKYPEETARKIVQVQKRRMEWVKKECDRIICISDSTKKDAVELLNIEEDRLAVVYPGVR